MPAEQLKPNEALTAALACATTTAPAANKASVGLQELAGRSHQACTASAPSGSCSSRAPAAAAAKAEGMQQQGIADESLRREDDVCGLASADPR
jgi:hypothetical protein